MVVQSNGISFFQLQIAVASLKRVVLRWGNPPKKSPHKSVCVFLGVNLKIFLSNCFIQVWAALFGGYFVDVQVV